MKKRRNKAIELNKQSNANERQEEQEEIANILTPIDHAVDLYNIKEAQKERYAQSHYDPVSKLKMGALS